MHKLLLGAQTRNLEPPLHQLLVEIDIRPHTHKYDKLVEDKPRRVRTLMRENPSGRARAAISLRRSDYGGGDGGMGGVGATLGAGALLAPGRCFCSSSVILCLTMF